MGCVRAGGRDAPEDDVGGEKFWGRGPLEDDDFVSEVRHILRAQRDEWVGACGEMTFGISTVRYAMNKAVAALVKSFHFNFKFFVEPLDCGVLFPRQSALAGQKTIG